MTWKMGYKVLRIQPSDGLLGGRTYWKHKTSYMFLHDCERAEGFGPFGCFDTYANAKRFANKCNGDTVYRCLYVESQEKRFYCLVNGQRREMVGTIPEGTVFADRIILLPRERKVKGE